jgi:hypothetical protein
MSFASFTECSFVDSEKAFKPFADPAFRSLLAPVQLVCHLTRFLGGGNVSYKARKGSTAIPGVTSP